MIQRSLIAVALLAAMTTASIAATGWTTGSINFRDGPGASYYKIGSIARCVQVEIGESQNGWYRIQWNGRWGWVAARYITSDAGYCSGGGYSKPAPSSY
jgi:uncharacterized protein YraI